MGMGGGSPGGFGSSLSSGYGGGYSSSRKH
jgi:hypothetical protein